MHDNDPGFLIDMADRRILGAVIGGGQSRRFGSDKALAMIDGQPMMAHVIAALRPQVAAIVICGRAWLDFECLADQRAPHSGPLAGLESALRHAADTGFDGVVSVPVDTLPLPADLVERLAGSGPAVFEHQYLIGYWPVTCLADLEDQLASGAFGVRAWISRARARLVSEPFAITNINRPADIVEPLQAPKPED